ncbi:hypothetical protein K9N68_33815 [Kovacikia minuta CCNUW1]|uniref:hypothetical protein n=1 Tax=Kovacikia minuta TaxID=2931930 RepID=UPI001CD024B7|nr:hypothetical protein [Kovacikia minuta]UBF26420.1 hypothetical protein K9N68_33815 [Kovacikia minuta CCNUW1]
MNLQIQNQATEAVKALANIELIQDCDVPNVVAGFIQWHCIEEIGLSEEEAVEWAASVHFELTSEALKNSFGGGY